MSGEDLGMGLQSDMVVESAWTVEHQHQTTMIVIVLADGTTLRHWCLGPDERPCEAHEFVGQVHCLAYQEDHPTSSQRVTIRLKTGGWLAFSTRLCEQPFTVGPIDGVATCL